jgi:hypothetical protein
MTRRHHILLSLILLIGATLRFWHLDWGTDPVDGRFHPLHPDERSLLPSGSRAAARLEAHDFILRCPLAVPAMATSDTVRFRGRVEPFHFDDPASTRAT